VLFAIATSKYWSGYFLENSTIPEPSRIAGVTAIQLAVFRRGFAQPVAKIFE
jgi:hypothetical protein